MDRGSLVRLRLRLKCWWNLQHGFVGFLSTAATELVWDQCFLLGKAQPACLFIIITIAAGWNRTEFLSKLSAQLLLLLRPQLLAANTRDELDSATASELGNLLTRQVLSVVRPLVQKSK